MNAKRVLTAMFLLFVMFANGAWADGDAYYVDKYGTASDDKIKYYMQSGSTEYNEDNWNNTVTGNNYPTLHGLLNATDISNDVIYIRGQYTLTNSNGDNGQIVIGNFRKLTLDLASDVIIGCSNGIGSNARLFQINSGDLTINGNGAMINADSTNGVGNPNTNNADGNNYGAFRVEVGGNVTLNNITLVNTRAWGLNVKVCGGKAVLNNVTINSKYGGGIEVTEADLGTESQAGTAVLNNCSFDQKGYFDHCSTCLSVSGGSKLIVNGGTFTSENHALYVFSSGGVIEVNGGTFIGNNKPCLQAEIDTNTYPQYVGGFQIHGGIFSGDRTITSPAYMYIDGGEFTFDPTQYLKVSADVTESDGKYTVTGISPSITVEKGVVGTTYEGSLNVSLLPANSGWTMQNVTVTPLDEMNSEDKSVTMNLTGSNLSFTPTEARDYVFRVSAELVSTDTNVKFNSTQVLLIPVADIQTTTDNSTVQSGAAYSGTLSSKVTPPTDWTPKKPTLSLKSVSPTTWSGLTITDGKLTGTAPVVVTATDFTVSLNADVSLLTTLNKQTAFTKTQDFTITVSPATVTVTPSAEALTSGTVNQEYSAEPSFTVSPAGLSYTITSASGLPAGLEVKDGKITGTPTESGTFTVTLTVTVTDSSDGSTTVNAKMSLVINAASNTYVVSSDATASEILSAIDQMDGEQKAAFTGISINNNSEIEDISEILTQLPNLKSVDVSNSSALKTVDLTSCENLTEFNAQNCTSLTEVNAENCTNLEKLDCSGGSVEKISLQGCENLKDLSCQNNNLESLDVSGCSNLTSLDCSANNIGDLNVDGCENLVNLKCGANSLSNLSITSCRRLQVLYCYSNNLTELNVQYSERLYILVCDDNSLNTLNVEQNKLLRRLDCQNNAMPALDITSSVFAQLQRLKCYGQNLTGLTLSQSGGQYSFNLRSYMQSGIQSKTFSAASLNADNDDLNNFYSSSSIDNVDETSIKAYDADGNEIEVTGYTSGVISFASKPAKIVYDYDTGYNNTMMDVTISEQTKRNGGSTVETKTSGGGGGGGGCDAGFGIFSLLIILAGFFGIKMGTKN